MAPFETGIDEELLASWRKAASRWIGDEKRVRFGVALAFGLLGQLAVLRPLATALTHARDDHRQARALLEAAEDARFLSGQLAALRAGTASGTDAVGWQSYVLTSIEASGTRLVGMEPHATILEGPYRIVELLVEAEGAFENLVDLVDRLERGPRLVRLRDLALRPGDETVRMEATLHGLVDPMAGGDGDA